MSGVCSHVAKKNQRRELDAKVGVEHSYTHYLMFMLHKICSFYRAVFCFQFHHENLWLLLLNLLAPLNMMSPELVQILAPCLLNFGK